MSCSIFACCSLFQMEGSKKWECVSYGKMELCRGKAASSRPRSLHVCAWLPPGRYSGYCRDIKTGLGENHGLQQHAQKILHYPTNLQICQIQTFIYVSVSVTRLFFFWRIRNQGMMPAHRESETPGRFITSVTSLNRQPEQWDPNYKRGAWQYPKKTLCIRLVLKPPQQ